MISQITTQISGHCDRSHILWYIVFLSSILSIHLSRSSPRALWELEAWEAVLLTAGMWAGKSLHLFRCGLHGLEDKWPGSLSRWPYLSFVQTLYFCKCCCLFVFNIAQWFEGGGCGCLPLNFTLNQLFVHTPLSSVSSHRLYELVDWSRIKIALIVLIGDRKRPLKHSSFHPKKSRKQHFG